MDWKTNTIFRKKKRDFQKKIQKRGPILKKKESATIAAKKIISLENANRLKLIMRKLTIPKKNENEKLRKSLSRKNLEKP
jgi:hypothetical protein